MTCALLALAVQAAPSSTAAERARQSSDSKTAADEQPFVSAKAVIAKFVQVIGGAEAFGRIKSQHVTGKVSMPAQGIEGDMEVFASRPDKLILNITIPGVGVMKQGYDGDVAWSVNALTGPMILEGKMLEQFKEQADFDAVLHRESNYKSLEVLGSETFFGKTCHKLKTVRHSGSVTTEFYDKASGFLLGSIAVQESSMGAMVVTNILSDYKKFGEVMFATKITQKAGPLEQIITISTLKVNEVPDAAFDLPEEIKTLTKK